MYVYVVVTAVSIFVGAGIIWLLKNRFSEAVEPEAVPISDISEIRKAESRTETVSAEGNGKQNPRSADNLKAEILVLKQKINQLSREYKQKVTGLEKENAQLKDAVKKEIALRDNVHDKENNGLFGQMQQDLREARDAIETLSAENARLHRQIRSLSKERDGLFKERSQLAIDLKRVEEHNAQLLEKEQFLQYELTKATAKAMGLEKICEEFKKRLELIGR